jgi:hypothetical protein
MQEALETFEAYASVHQWVNARSLEVMYALRDRLAQPEREWVGLTDEEIKERWIASYAALPRYACFASEIEAKLKEKNT